MTLSFFFCVCHRNWRELESLLQYRFTFLPLLILPPLPLSLQLFYPLEPKHTYFPSSGRRPHAPRPPHSSSSLSSSVVLIAAHPVRFRPSSRQLQDEEEDDGDKSAPPPLVRQAAKKILCLSAELRGRPWQPASLFTWLAHRHAVAMTTRRLP